LAQNVLVQSSPGVAVVTENLTRAFPSGLAVDHVSFELPAGEVLALLGPNGAGKTTTVRLLNGVLAADGGRASVLGLDPATDGHAIRQRTGVLTENAGLDDRLTAAENLLVAARLRGWRGAAAERVVREQLERFGMAGRGDDLTQGFSTGQRKRVALARALLAEPELLFLDEPTAGLDPTATRDVADLIKQLAGEHGRTVVLATHFLGEAGALADRMAVLHRGRLAAVGRPDELARDLWQGIGVDLELATMADGPTIGALRALDGVLDAAPTSVGARAQVRDREVLPAIVRLLGDLGVALYGLQSRPPTLEDVYYEVEARARAAHDPVAADDAPQVVVR
jgi:ABC-2 type transport system ATP-binding protein